MIRYGSSSAKLCVLLGAGVVGLVDIGASWPYSPPVTERSS